MIISTKVVASAPDVPMNATAPPYFLLNTCKMMSNISYYIINICAIQGNHGVLAEDYSCDFSYNMIECLEKI